MLVIEVVTLDFCIWDGAYGYPDLCAEQGRNSPSLPT